MIISIDSPEKLESVKAQNKIEAELALEKLIDEVMRDQARALLGLPVNDVVAMEDLKSYAAKLEQCVVNPSAGTKISLPEVPGKIIVPGGKESSKS